MAHLSSPLAAALIGLLASLSSAARASDESGTLALFDEKRSRRIPVEIYLPSESIRCTAERRCPVAVVSAGYGVRHTSYSFIADALNDQGYLVVAVQHELPSDPPLAREGDLFALRSQAWKRGAENIRFVRSTLSAKYPFFEWEQLVLVGHSNGGDISAWLVMESPSEVAALVTLDHRRVPLPQSAFPRTLSIRASDFEADHGVLNPTACIVTLGYARHNDMSDAGSPRLRSDVSSIMRSFLNGGECPTGEV